MSVSIAKTHARNSSIELLRFIFMFFVVLSHVYVHGNHLNYEVIYDYGKELSSAIHLSLFTLSVTGVTGFMFISGYYGIRMTKKKWVSMLAMLLFYSIALSIGIGSFGLHTLNIVLHPFDLWWFMAAYLFICVLSPIIEEGIKRIDEATFRYVVVGLLFYNYVAHFLTFENSHDVLLLLTIYFTARYLRIYPPQNY